MKRTLLSLKKPQSPRTMTRRCFSNCQRLLLVALFALCGTTGVEAIITRPISYSGYYFVIDTDKQAAQVVYNDAYKTLTEVKIPSSVRHSNKDYPVTAISNGAFKDCANITKIIIPTSCTNFTSRAFEGCTGVTELHCNAYVTSFEAFSGLTNLQVTSITISGYTVPDEFKGHDKIREVYIYGYYNNIADNAFDNCKNLQKAHFYSDHLEGFGNRVFYNCSNLKECHIKKPEQLMTIGYEAFCDCSKLTTFPLGLTSVEEIGLKTFYYCSQFDCVFPKTLTKIGYAAFNKTSITQPRLDLTAVTYIDADAFGFCYKLKTLSYPSTLVWIGDNAFRYCMCINEADLSNTNVTSIGKNAYQECTSLKTISFPPSLTTLKESAFAETDVSSIDGLDKTQLITISSNAFKNCSGLRSLTLPNTLQCIEKKAFMGCENLQNVSFGKDMELIQDSAFFWCNALKTVTTLSNSAIGLGIDAFNSALTKNERNPIFIDYRLYYYYSACGWEHYFNFTFPSASEIRIDKPYVTINKGETTTLTATVLPIYADQTLRWETNNFIVAPVNNGEVLGANDGFATITATTSNGIKATWKVWVGLFGTFDVNKDGEVNSTDVVAFYNYIDKGSSDGASEADFDFNKDGEVNSGDVVAFYNYTLNGE